MCFPSNNLSLVIILIMLAVPTLITVEQMGLLNIFEEVQNMRLTFNIDGMMSMVTYLNFGNATKNINCKNSTKKFSLNLDFNNPKDGFENLLGCQDFSKGVEGKKELELSTESQKDEEIKRLWTLLCPEEGKEKQNIVLRSEWGSEEQVIRNRRAQAADFLVVDGFKYYTNSTNYFAYMQQIKAHQRKYYGDLTGNFWITDDGDVIEGIGWGHYNYVLNGGLGPNSLIIAFIKKEKDASPSAAAIVAFRELVRTAICTKNLSPHYSLIPYYLISDYQSLSSKSFERKEMREWNWYKDNLDFLLPIESEEKRTQPIVSRFEWSGRIPKDDLVTLPSPIELLVVCHLSVRCFRNCRNHLKVLERELILSYEDMHLNFLVAEDGRAYEAEGWHKTWNEKHQEKKAVVVAFSGSFNSYSPHENIFLALQSVIEEGLRLGKLSTSYKIVIEKAFDPKSEQIGTLLLEKIHKLDRHIEILNV